jgi:hypothetical protein
VLWHRVGVQSVKVRGVSVVRRLAVDRLHRIGVTPAPEGLSLIHTETCAAMIWERAPLQGFQDWMHRQASETLPYARLILRPDMVHRALSDVVRGSALPSSHERDMLVDDMAALAFIFADVMRASFLRLRLKVCSGETGKVFCAAPDAARLICTYRGPGTEFRLGADQSTPGRVSKAPTCAAVLMRGALWPRQTNSGLLHRAPATNETRLVLVLDSVLEADADHKAQTLH